MESTTLVWDGSQAPDFDYFTVYGSDSGTFDPETAELIGYTIHTSLDVAGTDFSYYHVTATDYAGNESDASTIPHGSVSIHQAEALPRVWALHACRPNPFNPVTTIRYDLPSAAPVRLHVYDLLGREIRALVDVQEHVPGRHRIEWDGRDNAGKSVGSGLYFCRLKAGPFTQTRRMMLLK
jgi:hypothetical protein